MFATRRDQENAVHRQQLTKGDGGKALAHKTPHQTSKTPFKKQSDENNVFTKADGKVKGVVAALEAKNSTASFCTPVGPRLRAPLGTKTGNVKATVFQTPANLLTVQRPLPKRTSPRLRKPKFHVHDGEVATREPEVREIEYMHPREEPLPDIPDEEIWAQDRQYPQFAGKNFTKDWAMDFCNDDNESFDTKLRRFEEAELKKKSRPLARPETISAVKAAAALSSVRGVGNFASATTSSAARAVRRPAAAGRTARPSNPRHIVAKTVSNTTLGYSKGRQVVARAASESSDDMSAITQEDRKNLLQSMWQSISVDDDELDELVSQPIDILALEKLRDLDLDSLPDD